MASLKHVLGIQHVPKTYSLFLYIQIKNYRHFYLKVRYNRSDPIKATVGFTKLFVFHRFCQSREAIVAVSAKRVKPELLGRFFSAVA